MNIELRGISKRFGPVQANKDIHLDIRAGEVLGLLGENGAGKSTLMNVLSGLYRPDSGDILIDGTPVVFDGPGDSIAAGIGMVHQHFMLVPVFSVVENVILGVEPTGNGDFLDLATARQQVQAINARYGMDVPSDTLIEDLPVGIQQRVEILKVLFRSADVLILDEPTAVLTPQEVEAFFGIVRALRDAGKAIVFITHKLHEIIEIADKVSVLRQGEIVGGGVPSRFSEADLAEMMVGRPVSFSVGRSAATPAAEMLALQDVTLVDAQMETRLHQISMSVRAGEIVGIAGVQGNGQTELVEAITGLSPVTDGAVLFDGQDITASSVRQRHQMGIAHIPEDRQKSGMVPAFTVTENMVLNSYYDDRVSRGVQIDWRRAERQAAEACLKFDVRTPSIFLGAGGLSGGNQQKLVVARELERNVRLVVASQPTRGVDVGSIEFIHKQLVACRDAGNAVLIISSELDEILDLSDRIYVMYEGRITATFDNGSNSGDAGGISPAGAQADRNAIGLAMAGVSHAGANTDPASLTGANRTSAT